MNEIKVALNNLKDNEREQLLALIEKANKKPKRFKPEVDDRYWFVCKAGEIGWDYWENGGYNIKLYDTNNCFKTKEEAKFEAEKRKVIAELEIFALENNDEIDWGNLEQEKYFFYYTFDEMHIDIGKNRYCFRQGTIYFSSEELCEQAIKKVGEDRIEKYLFGVED